MAYRARSEQTESADNQGLHSGQVWQHSVNTVATHHKDYGPHLEIVIISVKQRLVTGQVQLLVVHRFVQLSLLKGQTMVAIKRNVIALPKAAQTHLEIISAFTMDNGWAQIPVRAAASDGAQQQQHHRRIHVVVEQLHPAYAETNTTVV